ncbi:MAG TPA: hypothetical protein VF522_14730 [Ramlibacter sp.]|uniref:hypothetical protein n=1 Tax=Ramlibacter sp. TaxID=1917967 RepID=UPI002ED28AAF
MNAQELARIRASAGWRRDRMESFETEEGPVIVKAQRPPRPPIAAWSLKLLSGLARSPELKPVPAPGGAAGQAIEVQRLTILRMAGVRVPAVVHVDSEFFVMERLAGQSLAERMDANPSDARALWEQGLRFVHGVHARGQCLSQAVARNLIVAADGIAAIDFEDDPLQVLSLREAQVRDWLLYLQSTVWLLPPSHEDLLPVWERFAPAGADAAAMLRSVGRMAWMRHLPNQRRPWGRDIVSAQAAAALLHAWARRQQAH